MKTKVFIISSLLSICAHSQINITNPKIGEPYQFVVSGLETQMNLCLSEICRSGDNGREFVERVPIRGRDDLIRQVVESNGEINLVFYPKGREGKPAHRHILRNRFLIKITDATSLIDLKQQFGLVKVEPILDGQPYILCETHNAAETLSKISDVQAAKPGLQISPLLARVRTRNMPPTDPLYRALPDYQWHLENVGLNGGVIGNDINILGAWENYSGQDVIVGVVDDGLANSHPDLMDNVNTDIDVSANFPDPNDSTPPALPPQNPFDQDDRRTGQFTHGTAVAGIIGASWNNQGGAGIAANCELVGIEMLAADFVDDATVARSLVHSVDVIDIYNNSWGVGLRDSFLFPEAEVVLAALQTGAATGRDGKGSIYIKSAGNDGEFFDDANYQETNNAIETVTIGAIGDTGRRAAYSNRGANLVVSAPSGDDPTRHQDITTTSFTSEDRLDEDGNIVEGEYDLNYDGLNGFTTEFSGTSAAAPMVSGVVALMLEANPDLGWRDVQEILMMSATKLRSNSGGWITNAAGLNFNYDYGAGRVNASAAVEMASQRGADVLAPAVFQEAQVFVSAEDEENLGNIPDADGTSYIFRIQDFVDQPNLRIEHVEVSPNVITSRRTDMEISLISPSGTSSILTRTIPENGEDSIRDFTFMTVRNWGEGSKGEWIIRIKDNVPGPPDRVSLLNALTVRIHGVEDSNAPVESLPFILSERLIEGIEGLQLNTIVEFFKTNSVSFGELPPGLTYDPVTKIVSGVPSQSGIYQVPVTLSGPDGIAETTLSFLIEPAGTSFGQIVGDGIDVNSETNGIYPWVLDTTSPDGLGVASAVNLPDSQPSTINLGSFDAGVIGFNWRVSSEEGGDRLYVNRGGPTLQVWDAFIDGISGWAPVVISSPSPANLTFTYIKNDLQNSRQGEDRGFVDNITYTSFEEYQMAVIEAANITPGVFESSSRCGWVPIDDTTIAGGADARSIRASAIGNGQLVNMILDGPAGGQLTFDYKISADPSDRIEVLVDGVPVIVDSRDGIATWETAVVDLPTGRNSIIEILFRKDSTFADGDDTLFLNNITLTSPLAFSAWVGDLGDGNMDADGDGYTNEMEYSFGGNPAVADEPILLPLILDTANGPILEFGINLGAVDREFEFQGSNDLDNWIKLPMPSPTRTVGNFRYFQIDLPAESAGYKFFRVEAKKVESAN